MEPNDAVGNNGGDILKKVNPNLVFILAIMLGLYIFPLALLVLVPIFLFMYSRTHRSSVVTVAGQRVVKRKDWRGFPAMLAVLATALLVLYLTDRPRDFGENILIIGICTGGFIWAPVASYLIGKLLLFIYDRVTGNTTYTAHIENPVDAAPAPIPFVEADLSPLSPNEQSLVRYMADAARRGVREDEMTLILKGNGWLPEDITHGFVLVRSYYPGLLK